MLDRPAVLILPTRKYRAACENEDTKIQARDARLDCKINTRRNSEWSELSVSCSAMWSYDGSGHRRMHKVDLWLYAAATRGTEWQARDAKLRIGGVCVPSSSSLWGYVNSRDPVVLNNSQQYSFGTDWMEYSVVVAIIIIIISGCILIPIPLERA